MSRWIAYRVRAIHLGGMGRSLEKLGAFNAPHHPAAVMKARERWPDVPPDKLTVQLPTGKRLASLARARRVNSQIRKAYLEERARER